MKRLIIPLLILIILPFGNSESFSVLDHLLIAEWDPQSVRTLIFLPYTIMLAIAAFTSMQLCSGEEITRLPKRLLTPKERLAEEVWIKKITKTQANLKKIRFSGPLIYMLSILGISFYAVIAISTIFIIIIAFHYLDWHERTLLKNLKIDCKAREIDEISIQTSIENLT